MPLYTNKYRPKIATAL